RCPSFIHYGRRHDCDLCTDRYTQPAIRQVTFRYPSSSGQLDIPARFDTHAKANQPALEYHLSVSLRGAFKMQILPLLNGSKSWFEAVWLLYFGHRLASAHQAR